MGSKTDAPRKGQPKRTYADSIEVESARAGSTSSIGNERGEADSDCIEIDLIQVDATHMSQVAAGALAWLVDSEVHSSPGRLGDVPHQRRSFVKREGYCRGIVVAVDIPKVRLCK